jgi:hypothetical protein
VNCSLYLLCPSIAFKWVLEEEAMLECEPIDKSHNNLFHWIRKLLWFILDIYSY